MKISGFIEKKNLIPWIENMSKGYKIFLPVQDQENSRIDFMDYETFLEKKGSRDEKNKEYYSMNFYEKTKLSPKIVFFPETEKFFDFEYIKEIKESESKNTDIIITKPEKELPRMLLGVKPCDLAGLKRLDMFYGEGQKKDSYYMDKRKDSIVISIGCTDPFPDCFCTSVDGHPFDFENSDIGLVETDKGYAIVRSSEKAKKLLEDNKRFINDKFKEDEYKVDVDEVVKKYEEKIKE